MSTTKIGASPHEHTATVARASRPESSSSYSFKVPGSAQSTSDVTPAQGSPEHKAVDTLETVEAKGGVDDLANMHDWATGSHNPRNWSSKKKWTTATIGSWYTFVPALASSMMAPGLREVAANYSITNSSVLSLTLSIFLLSFAIGPLVFAPLSEIYGRSLILHSTNILSLGFALGCAFAPDTGSFIAFRFLLGFSGSAPTAIGPGLVGDLFAAHERGSAMSLYALGPLFAPAIGPVAGGYLAQYASIKYIFILLAALFGVAALAGVPLMQETYEPVIQYRMAKKAGDVLRMKELRKIQTEGSGSTAGFLWRSGVRPIVYLTRSLICFVFGLYLAVVYGIYYLMLATFPPFFSETYGFKAGTGGLMYLGLGVGLVIAGIVGGKMSDSSYQKQTQKNGGVGKPEFRMPAVAPGAIAIPVGLFWYGWSAQAKLHWIMPVVGTGFFGFGFMATYLPVQLYLVDSFKYAASASASAFFFRSLFGFFFPLFGQQMFDAMGLGGGNSFLAAVSIVLGIPFPIWIFYKGEDRKSVV